MQPRLPDRVSLALALACLSIAACDTGSNTSAITIPNTDCTAQIGDRVWKDQNGNGVQDTGEPGLAGVSVTISTPSGPLETVVTDASGKYAFTVTLCAGTYIIDVVTPVDLVPTLVGAGGDPTLDSELSPATVVLPTDATMDLDVDFGFSGTGSIGDRVWVDGNCDGLQDPNELDLDGVRVQLTDGRGIDRETVTTGGIYLFTGLCAGAYTVTVDETTVGSGLVATQSNVGFDPAVDSNGSPASVTLASNGERNVTIDFGYCVRPDLGSIGDFIWHDLDRDGLQDANEPGVPGVGVFLADAGGTGITTTLTDANGHYLFDFLTAGDYLVEVGAPSCYRAAPCNVGGDDTIDNDCSPVLVSLAAGQHDHTIDFGYQRVGAAQIGDFVWNDLDADGIQDPGEPGIEMAEVSLFNEWGFLIVKQWTGPDGAYLFESLCAGMYEVRVDVSAAGAGFVPSPCNFGGDDTVDNDCSPAQVILPFDDTIDLTVDFGYHVPAPLAGCSHGYWKNHSGSWVGPYSPSTPFSEVFEDAFPGLTLLEALQQGGGGLNALGREAVAGLLNAASPTVPYPLPDREIIDRFDAAHPGTKQEYNQLKDEIEAFNQLGCPLN
jgi:hypothetical protein